MPHDDASKTGWDLGVPKLLAVPAALGLPGTLKGPHCAGVSGETSLVNQGQAGEGWAQPPGWRREEERQWGLLSHSPGLAASLPWKREVFSLSQRVEAVLVSCATEWENQLHELQLSPL